MGTIAACTVAASAGVANGAWCSSFTFNCLAYAPLDLLGGIAFFGIPSAVIATLVVLALTFQPSGRARAMRITPISFALLVLSHAALGFSVGITLLRGQGP